jgi:hypothetical protein
VAATGRGLMTPWERSVSYTDSARARSWVSAAALFKAIAMISPKSGK